MKTLALPLLALLAAGCASRYGTELVVCDHQFPIGTRVVLWDEAVGFDAYSQDPAFPKDLPEDAEPPSGPRYGSRVPRDAALAAEVEASGWTLDALRRQVDQVVLHYDAAGTSRRCFRILQDLRGLSCHFLIDVDGTIYQCLDLRERAWHAGKANDRSVGIELAQIGAWPEERRDVLEEHYAEDGLGPYLVLPEGPDRGQLSPGLVVRPARRALLEGEVQGRRWLQYDFTRAQYRALIKLLRVICKELPAIAVDVPRDGDGALRTTALSAEELAAFQGLLGHFHVSAEKHDPGPAFSWRELLRGLRGAPLHP